MPIQNGRYINPGWLDNGPPAIDAAELNAISDTLENLDAGGGAGGEGKRYARFVIGTSTNGWTAADCDYLCDGVDDQEEFNQAIAAFGSAPASGSRGAIVILSGTYHLTAPLSQLTGISLIGTGGVILLRETATGNSQYNYMIGIAYGSIENITYYVSDGLTFPSSRETIEIFLSADSKIRNCDIRRFYSTAIGIDASNIIGIVQVSGNTFFGSGGNENAMDIHLTSGVFTIIENNFLSQKIYVDGTAPGTIYDFRVQNNSYTGPTSGEIILDGASNGVIAGNTVRNIKVLNTGKVNTLVGNIISGNIMGGTSGSPEPLITLGENTSRNYIFGNSLYFNVAMGYVQDNGTDNYVYDWQSGGTQGGQVTLPTSSWSSNTQTVSAPGVTATNYVNVGPDPSDFAAAMEAGVYCSGQGNGTLTFTCSTTPTTAITINYTAQEVL